MTQIPLYNTFSKIQPITKGMSGNKKYYIETVDQSVSVPSSR